MSSTVSDIGNQINTQYLLRILRGDMNDTQRQITSGKKSTTIGGLGASGASNAISFRNKSQVLDAYTENLKQSKVKFEVMDNAMLEVADAGRDMLATLRKQLQGTEPKAAILSSEADAALQVVREKLNAQVNGKYLFAGDDLFNAPFSNPTALDANITALIPGFLAGTTPAAVMAALRGETGTDLGFSASSLASGNISFRADDNLDIDYTVKGHQAGFADVLRGLTTISNLPQPTTAAEQTNYWNVVNGVIELLDEGTKQIDGYQGELGNKANLVTSLLDQHEESQATFSEYLGSVEDVDMAKASVDLQNLQFQLQASYNVIAQLKTMSLVNFL